MIVTAKSKNIRTAPRKIRLVLAAIHGLSVTRAKNELEYVPRQGARDVLKTLKSAIASAKEKGIEEDNLAISRAYCNEGQKLKRRILAAHGSSKPINKHWSHLYISLTDQKEKQHGA